MLDGLDIFRIRFGGRPLLLWIACLGLLLLASRLRPFRAPAPRVTVIAAHLVAAVGLLGLVAYFGSAIWYASDPHFFDNAEPTMAAVGWLFHVGQPVYHAIDSAERYAHVYGPMAFMLQGFVLGAVGPSIAVSKALGAVAGLASVALVYAALQLHAPRRRAIVLTGVYALLLLVFRHYSFWTRPDSLQVMAVSASLLLAARARGYAALLAVGIASGVLWDLKFTGPLYSLPIFVLLHRRTGWTGVFVSAATGVVVAMAPFVAYDNVSLGHYVAWLRLSAQTGILLSTLRQNLEWAAYFSLPLLISYYALPRDRRPTGTEWRNMLLALLVGVAGVVIAAAKPGAGPYHLMPFLPVILFLVAWNMAHVPEDGSTDPVVPHAAIAFALTALVLAAANQAQLVSTMAERRTRGELEDVERFAREHAGVIAIGYGETEALSLERPALVFRSGVYLLDQPAVREHQLAGLEVPQATIDALAACRVDYWLIPKGEAPFAGRNSYTSMLLRPLFPDGFRRAFNAAHTRVETTTYFDVWRCRSRTGS
jgi:hypothetical protein